MIAARHDRAVHALLAFALAMLLGCAPAWAARHALVVGNNAYPSGQLRSAVNDARDMAQALQQLGFEVLLRENATREQMFLAIREFGTRLREGDTALFFYAGHAIQLRDRNYLVPVDAQLQQEDDVTFFSFDVSEVLQRMDRARTRFNVLMLDACRDNPFASTVRFSQAGLAQMSAPPGTLIAYATAPGQVAREGGGRNGVYTRHLLRQIGTPDLPVEQMLKRVRDGVLNETRGQQVPWDASSLRSDLVLAGSAPAQAAGRPAPGGITAETRTAVDRTFWESIKDSRNVKEYEAYLEQFPDGVFAVLAQSRLAQLRARGGAAADTASAASAVPSSATATAAGPSGTATPAPGSATAPTSPPVPGRESGAVSGTASAPLPAAPSNLAAPASTAASASAAAPASTAASASTSAPASTAASGPATGTTAAPPSANSAPAAPASAGTAPAPRPAGEPPAQVASRSAGTTINGTKAPAAAAAAPAQVALATPGTPAPAGATTIVLSDGSSYTGTLRDGRPHGTGRLVSATAGTYEGAFVAGHREGEGDQTWPGGDRYVGTFRSDAPHGRGTTRFANGDRYEGGYDHGRFDGQGVLVTAAGYRYQGAFKAGRREGRGQATFPNGDRYEGEFRADVPAGTGAMHYASGDRYEGGFAGGRPSGRGKYTFAGGARYEGEFHDGEMSGLGTYYHPNGDRHEGLFEAGAASGAGVYFFAGGARFEGTFSQKGRAATGFMIDASGTRRPGVLENGQFKSRDG